MFPPQQKAIFGAKNQGDLRGNDWGTPPTSWRRLNDAMAPSPKRTAGETSLQN